MLSLATPAQWILSFVLILSSLGILVVRKPVHACLCFLLTLISLAALYLQLSAEFIAVIQILVYAGAILVIFMFVIVLFQDAHHKIDLIKANSSYVLLSLAGTLFLLMLLFVGTQIIEVVSSHEKLPEGFGLVKTLGKLLYIDFFFPFEAVILLFLIATIGALYIGRKEKAE